MGLPSSGHSSSVRPFCPQFDSRVCQARYGFVGRDVFHLKRREKPDINFGQCPIVAGVTPVQNSDRIISVWSTAMPTTYLELNKTLSEEESSLKEQVHRFAAEVLRPAAMELDPLSPKTSSPTGSPLWDVFRKYRELGYHLRGMPEEFGGIDAVADRRSTSSARRWAGAPPTWRFRWAPARCRTPSLPAAATQNLIETYVTSLRRGHRGPLRRLLGHHRASTRLGRRVHGQRHGAPAGRCLRPLRRAGGRRLGPPRPEVVLGLQRHDRYALYGPHGRRPKPRAWPAAPSPSFRSTCRESPRASRSTSSVSAP